MQLVFSDQDLPSVVQKSIFLEGPSPRELETLDWRRQAVEILKQLHYDGVVYIPCPQKVWDKQKEGKWDYDSQVEWEHKARFASDAIVCWVPRELEKMPALTTNVEFGEDFDLGRFYYGRPDWAVKCKYLDSKTKKQSIPVYSELDNLLSDVVSTLKPIYRVGVLATIPALAWEFDSFRQWLDSMEKAGNELTEACITHVVGNANKAFLIVIQAKVFVLKENRIKSNESVIFRKNTVTVVPYFVEHDGSLSYVLVNEFRAAINSSAGVVKEFVSGSSSDNSATVLETLKEELHEELGIAPDVSRLIKLGEKQINSTLLGHKTAVYALELNKEEYQTIKQAQEDGKVFGEANSSELITLTTCKKDELIKSCATDCTTLAATLMLENYLLEKSGLKQSIQSLAKNVLLFGAPDREQTNKRLQEIIHLLNTFY